MQATAAVECMDLSKTYATGWFTQPVKALDHLNLRVEQGEIFGFLGPNGAGKTTTIRLILNLLRPTAGQCKIFGLDAQRDSVVIKHEVGNLPSELRLWEHLTGEQTLRYLAKLRPNMDIQYGLALAERFQLRLNMPIRQYSTGNKRKVGIIQALMHKPALVILDEPTSGLDPFMRHTLADLLNEIRAEGRTVFLSSHVLSEVRTICDRVAILKAGKLQAVDTIENLMRARRIDIVTRDTIDLAQLSAVAGVEAVGTASRGYHVQLNGSMNHLIKFLAQYEIDNVKPEEFSLEHAFVDFYDDSEDEADV